MCPDCQDLGRIRVITQRGEYTHEHEEFCPCPVGEKRKQQSMPAVTVTITDDTGEFVPLAERDQPGGNRDAQ